MPINVKSWAAAHLLDGDELGSTSTRNVVGAHDLARLYGVTAQEIVARNGVQFTSSAIDAWVLRTGGKKLSNGQPVFTARSVILLPIGGPRAPASSAPAEAAAPSVLPMVLGAVGGVVIFKSLFGAVIGAAIGRVVAGVMS